MKRILVIAEAGVNHNGSLETAKRLVEVAANAGADFVKFQTFNADDIVTKTADKAEYQKIATGNDVSQYEMLKSLELTSDMHEQLLEHCDNFSIGFLSTGFDQSSVAYLVSLGQQLVKVPSGEITNLPYLKFVGSLGLPVILSTGMSSLEEVGDALNVLKNAGTDNDRVTVLHCTSEYPAPFENVNLNAMQTISKEFGVSVGYSDHTTGIEISIAAAALGATVIEKHFTLDRALPGPDHKASLEPDELVALVKSIRNIEIALGDGSKVPSNGENKNKLIARKSIVARQDIHSGDSFTLDNLTTKRPGTGVSPMKWHEILGKTATRDYLQDEIIEL
jgi:N,N'-diacetyllegionaminate synthase